MYSVMSGADTVSVCPLVVTLRIPTVIGCALGYSRISCLGPFIGDIAGFGGNSPLPVNAPLKPPYPLTNPPKNA